MKESSSWNDTAVDVDSYADVTDVSLSPEAEDVADLLAVEPAILLTQASRIHAMVIKWTETVADLEKQASSLRLAREVRGSFVREDRRAYLMSNSSKVTEGGLEAHALTDTQYLALRRARIDALSELAKAKGVLSAVYTKSRIAQAMLYSMGQGNRVAEHHVMPDLSVE